MNEQKWYPLPLEVEHLWEWIVRQDPSRKCRYDLASIRQSLGVSSTDQVLSWIKQLTEYNYRVEPEDPIIVLGEYSGMACVNVKDAAQRTWLAYQREKKQRTCPECGKTSRKRVKAMWCPHCNHFDGPLA